MEPSARLPFVVHLDDLDDPGDVIDALVLDAFVSGAQPWARSKWLNRVRPEAPLLPPGVQPARFARLSGRHASLAVGEGWTLSAVRWSDRSARLTVTAVTDKMAEMVLEQATEDAVEPARPEDEALTMGFWHFARSKPKRTARSVEIFPWSTVRRNYAESVAGALDRVMAMEAKEVAGSLLLLHGPPGTGKTTALRALAHAWRKWCRVELVMDSDRLFADPSYLMEVALGKDDEDEERRQYRLIILEDCDELIRAEAKRGMGQALSRLLNLTDGLMGQSLDVLVAITTNEELCRLHPAVARPGRCLAEIEVGRFPRKEAAMWLGSPAGIGADGATLAELYALKGELEKVERSEPASPRGMYL